MEQVSSEVLDGQTTQNATQEHTRGASVGNDNTCNQSMAALQRPDWVMSLPVQRMRRCAACPPKPNLASMHSP